VQATAGERVEVVATVGREEATAVGVAAAATAAAATGMVATVRVVEAVASWKTGTPVSRQYPTS
jgi:hypothetical protein